MKKCSKCSELKPVEMFAKCKVSKDGLQYKCKQCDKLNSKQRRNDNPGYYKQWHKDNLEYKKQQSKQWRLNNPECKKQMDKQYHESLKLPYHIVYLLPDHNYVGVTNNPTCRMNRHRNGHKRNTSNWVELACFDSRKDALKCEAEYHAKGYEGSGKTKVVD